MTDLREILYVSQLAPGQPADIVGRIVSQARSRNAANGISGLLVFDGFRFCQHFEGPRDAVRTLMARLEQDPRHTDLLVLFEGRLDERRYPRFEVGLAEVDDRDDLAEIHGLGGAEALHRFLQLRPGFDISG